MATYRSLSDLANTTQDELLVGIIDALKKNDEFTAALVSMAEVTDRPTIKGNRLASAGTPVYADCDTTITSEAISASPFSYDLMTLVRQFDCCTTGQNLYGSFTNVVASELEGALKSLSEKIADDAMAGNGTTEIAGLETQITNSFNRAGASLDLSDVDRLFDEVLSRGPNMVMVGAPATVRTVLAEIRSEAGGLTYDTLAGTAMKVPTYLGVPVLRNQFATANYLHLVNMDDFKLYFGESEDANVGGIFSLQDIGALESKLAKRWRVYAHLASVLKNTQGAATLINA